MLYNLPMSLDRRLLSKLISNASYEILRDSAYACASAVGVILYLFCGLVSTSFEGDTGGLVSDELLGDLAVKKGYCKNTAKQNLHYKRLKLTKFKFQGLW